jgi:uncharacterized protein YcnI
MRRTIPATIVALVLVAPAAASAHITVQPASAPAGGFTRLDVRVPNERDGKGTVTVDVKLPPGILSVAYEPVPGWKAKVTTEKLAEPIKVEGFDVTEQVSRITWTGDGKQGLIAPGQFQDFGLSLAMPKGKPGDTLTFKALQIYEGGEVVRWIGPEGASEPAPTVALTTPATLSPSASATTGDGSDSLSIAALVAGALGLIAGLAGLLAARRATRPTTPGCTTA